MNKRNILSASLSLMVTAGLFAACGPTANQGTTPSTTAPSTTNGTTVDANVNTNTSTGSQVSTNVTATATTKSESSAELQAAMQAVVSDEASFKDAETATEAGFATKALEVEQSGEVSATLFTGDTLTATTSTEASADANSDTAADARAKANQVRARLNAARPQLVAAAQKARIAVRAETQARTAAKAETRKEMLLNKKASLEASGAVTVNDDGTVTVKPAELKAFITQNTQARRDQFKARMEQAKDKLQTLRALDQSEKVKLLRQNNEVSVSDKEEITNEDGSITTVRKVEFNNTKTGVTRNVVRTKTMQDDKIVSAFYELTATHANYTRTVERSVEVSENGERNVKVTAKTEWTNGKKRERSEERIVSADGSATGSGVVTVTRQDGTVKTYSYTVNIEANGELVVNGDNTMIEGQTTPAEEVTEVTVEGSVDATEATVIVEEAGEAATEVSLDLTADEEEAVEVEAAAEASAA